MDVILKGAAQQLMNDLMLKCTAWENLLTDLHTMHQNQFDQSDSCAFSPVQQPETTDIVQVCKYDTCVRNGYHILSAALSARYSPGCPGSFQGNPDWGWRHSFQAAPPHMELRTQTAEEHY